tara:strand:+ start:196479 stop:197585 length:1107 start_codon:yes stop_codon:yes gene_type:complete
MALQMKNHFYKSLFYGAICTYFVLILCGVKEFHLWAQIEELRHADVALNFSMIYAHPHGMRFMLVSPIYLLADLLHVAPDQIFSLVVVTMCAIVAISLASAIALFQNVKDIWAIRFFLFLCFAVLSLFMNGRLIFGFSAYSLMIYSVFLFVKESDNKKYFLAPALIFLAILFSSISSGVAISFFTISLSPMFILLVNSFRKRIRVKFYIAIYTLALFLLYTPIIYELINKNIAFFGEGFTAILAMTQHGTLNGFTDFFEAIFHRKEQVALAPVSGRYIVFKLLSIGFSLLLLCFVSIFRKNIIRNPHLLFTVYCMTLTMILSVFAYSILMMAFIPASMMLLFLASHFKVTGKHLFEVCHISTTNKLSH